MVIKYYIHQLSAEDARNDREAIARFPSIVNRVAPNGACNVAPLEDSKLAEIQDVIGSEQSFVDCAAAACGILAHEPGPFPSLVICCDTDSELALKAKHEAPHALWGARCGCLVAVYRHDPVLIWHEMFHLLGAEDCYVDGGTNDKTCGHDNCIMQYAPTVDVGDPPFLCEQNVQRINDQWTNAAGLSEISHG